MSLRNSEGNVLIIFLLAMAISTLAVFSFYYSRTTSFIANSVLQSTGANIQTVQGNLVSFLNNPIALADTLQTPANATLKSCMLDTAFDCPRGTFTMSIRDGLGGTYYDATVPGTGFDKNGVLCSTFSTGAQGTCQLRFDVTWSPECPPNGPCNMPGIIVSMNLITNGYKGVYSINVQPYRYVLRIN